MAQEAAAGKDILVGGSASVAKQYLVAGLLDQIDVHLVPLFLAEGARSGQVTPSLRRLLARLQRNVADPTGE